METLNPIIKIAILEIVVKQLALSCIDPKYFYHPVFEYTINNWLILNVKDVPDDEEPDFFKKFYHYINETSIRYVKKIRFSGDFRKKDLIKINEHFRKLVSNIPHYRVELHIDIPRKQEKLITFGEEVTQIRYTQPGLNLDDSHAKFFTKKYPNVESLYHAINYLGAPITLKLNYTKHWQNLKNLSLHLDLNTVIDGEVFINSPNLMTFKLKGAHADLTLNQFESKYFPVLEELHIETAKIVEKDSINIESLKMLYVGGSFIDLQRCEKSNLKNLKTIDLRCNSNNFNREIKDYKTVEKLVFINNRFTTLSPFIYFQKLKHLELAGGYIRKIQYLNNCTGLETLNFSANGINIVSGLDGLTKLKELDLHKNVIHSIEQDFTNFENLIKIDLENNKLRSVERLAKCKNLKLLNLANNDLIEDINDILTLPHLTNLYLSKTVKKLKINKLNIQLGD